MSIAYKNEFVNMAKLTIDISNNACYNQIMPDTESGEHGGAKMRNELENLAWLDAGQMWGMGWDAAEDGKPFEACTTRVERDGWCEYHRQQDLAVDEAQYTPQPGIDF